MSKKLVKRIVIITVLINIAIALFIGGKITFEKSKEAITREFEKNMPKFPGQDGGSSFMVGGEPVCASDYYAQLVYAYPKGVISKYQEMVPKLRSWFKNADGIVSEEAKKFNVKADLKVLCDKGNISVAEVALPNTSAYYVTQDTRALLLSDFASLGLNKKNAKYIVFYDGDGAGCGIARQATACVAQNSEKGPDDRLTVDNIYNFGPDYALLYRIDDARAQKEFGANYDMLAPVFMLHEYTHTMGAVQPSAPHATKKEDTPYQHHCTDSPFIGRGGTDIMCKSDGEGEVFGNACPGLYPFHFDCNNDDYFNPKPELGSYLATHWNLGSKLNRFIQFGEK